MRTSYGCRHRHFIPPPTLNQEPARDTSVGLHRISVVRKRLSTSKLCWPVFPPPCPEKEKARAKDGWCVFQRCGRAAAEESEKVTGRPFPQPPLLRPGSRGCRVCRGSCLCCCESVVRAKGTLPPLRGLRRARRSALASLLGCHSETRYAVKARRISRI